jgi:hypothetical protein
MNEGIDGYWKFAESVLGSLRVEKSIADLPESRKWSETWLDGVPVEWSAIGKQPQKSSSFRVGGDPLGTSLSL